MTSGGKALKFNRDTSDKVSKSPHPRGRPYSRGFRMNPASSKLAFLAHEPSSPGNEHSQLALWMSAGLAGMVSAVLLARAPFFQSLLARFGPERRARKPSPEKSLPMLASAILGSSRSTIQAVFGPPRSAVIDGIGVVVHPQQVYWQSDTWYYPLRRQGPMAIAINFDEDLATKVEFFTM